MKSNNLNHLTATEKTKRKSNHICKKCGGDIIVGEKYIGVEYKDGFTFRYYGSFHVECWNNFLINK